MFLVRSWYPIPDPCTVMDPDPVPPLFALVSDDVDAESYVMVSDKIATFAPIENDAVRVNTTLSVTLHDIVESEIQSLASQGVGPI